MVWQFVRSWTGPQASSACLPSFHCWFSPHPLSQGSAGSRPACKVCWKTKADGVRREAPLLSLMSDSEKYSVELISTSFIADFGICFTFSQCLSKRVPVPFFVYINPCWPCFWINYSSGCQYCCIPPFLTHFHGTVCYIFNLLFFSYLSCLCSFSGRKGESS